MIQYPRLHVPLIVLVAVLVLCSAPLAAQSPFPGDDAFARMEYTAAIATYDSLARVTAGRRAGAVAPGPGACLRRGRLPRRGEKAGLPHGGALRARGDADRLVAGREQHLAGGGPREYRDVRGEQEKDRPRQRHQAAAAAVDRAESPRRHRLVHPRHVLPGSRERELAGTDARQSAARKSAGGRVRGCGSRAPQGARDRPQTSSGIDSSSGWSIRSWTGMRTPASSSSSASRNPIQMASDRRRVEIARTWLEENGSGTR